MNKCKCEDKNTDYHLLHCVKPYSNLEERVRKIIVSACASVWKDTINDLSAKGSIQRSVNYAMREIMELINENNKI